MQRESANWIAAFHNPKFQERRLRTYRKKLDKLNLSSLLYCHGCTTLDVACGTGEALKVLAEDVKGRFIGVDLHAPVQKNLEEPFFRVIGDGRVLPFSSNSFDLILCLHSLHHFRSLHNIQCLLDECHRLLKSGGTLSLIDHFNSAFLRLIFHVCEWRFPFFPPFVKHFGEQLREEHDCIFWWLDNWDKLFAIIEKSKFRIVMEKRDPFFFYFNLQPE